jgi:hypothetical protein
LKKVGPKETSEDSESKMELLRELDSIDLSGEESRESANRAKGKRVMAWGKMRKTGKRTRVEMRASPKRLS